MLSKSSSLFSWLSKAIYYHRNQLTSKKPSREELVKILQDIKEIIPKKAGIFEKFKSNLVSIVDCI